MSNENENQLIQIEEEQPELEVKAPYVKPKKVLSEKQLSALQRGREKRVANAKQVSIEKQAKPKPAPRKKTPPIQKPPPPEVEEDVEIVYVDEEPEPVKPKKRIVYKTRPMEFAPELEPIQPPAPVVRRLRRV